jgi:ATP-dependent RNA helicase RhlE
LENFDSLGLAQPVLDAVHASGYEIPTPIQAKAIPPLLDGRDIVGLAQTGTGKTAAFVLPLLTRLLEDAKQPPGKTCRALILSPTRELAAQIGDSIATYSKGTGLKFGVICGGVKYGPQIKVLSRGLHVLVATPGRLMDHMKDDRVRLDFAETVILDEADQMLDLGFIPAIKKILGQVGTPRQTVMFSATMPPPIAKLANEFMYKAKTVSVAPTAKPADKVVQNVFYVEAGGKPTALIDTMAPHAGKRTIVFTRTKRGADRVCKRLREFGHTAAISHRASATGL